MRIFKEIKYFAIRILARFKIIDETAYLLKSKANADRLLKSINDYKATSFNLDNLTKEDYQKHFANQAKANRTNLVKQIDENVELWEAKNSVNKDTYELLSKTHFRSRSKS